MSFLSKMDKTEALLLLSTVLVFITFSVNVKFQSVKFQPHFIWHNDVSDAARTETIGQIWTGFQWFTDTLNLEAFYIPKRKE